MHTGMSRHAANCEIIRLGGLPYSIKDYAEIEAIPKSDMSKKRRNFDKLQAWMSDSLPFGWLRVGNGENLLEFARHKERWNNNGVRFPAEIMRHGQITSPLAAIM